MIALIITLLLGVAQMFVLGAVLKAVLGSNPLRAVLFLILKLLLYGAAAALIFTVFKAELILAAIGFAIGLPGAAIVFAIISLRRQNKTPPDKGDDALEHN